MHTRNESSDAVPGAKLRIDTMPGHWLLARMGKRVLRPGGLDLTRQMLVALAIQPTDAVVEFAPGLGITAQLALHHRPASYTSIERDENAAATVRRSLNGPQQRCIVGRAEATGLPTASATVLYGEAMLTMHPPARKAAIVHEAYRILQPGGRYGIHELSLVPDTLDAVTRTSIQRDLSRTIHVSASPLTPSEWRAVLETEGFQVQTEAHAPMHLLELQRMVRDEGLGRVIRIIFNIVRSSAARQRVLAMRQIFRKYRDHLAAISLVAVKPVNTPQQEG